MEVVWRDTLDLSYECIVVEGQQGLDEGVMDQGLKDVMAFEEVLEGPWEEPYKVMLYRLPRKEWPNKLIRIFYERAEIDYGCYQKSLGASVQLAEQAGIESVLVWTRTRGNEDNPDEWALQAGEAVILAQYKFDAYLTQAQKIKLKRVGIYYEKAVDEQVFREKWEERIGLAELVCAARDWVNGPANHMTPGALALKAEHLGQTYGFEVEILDESHILDLKMEAYYAVGKGSEEPPRLIVMRYFNDRDREKEVLGLVGKGITYDSGGLNIKTPAGMKNMRADMGGAAAVLGAMAALAKSKAKVNVVAVIPACENMISGRSYKIGDTISSMAGKTIFIESTDAEGRLTLADGVTYLIQKEGVNRLVDIATLTGAAGIALGHAATPVLSNDDVFFEKLEQAAAKSNEKIWRMPIFEDYKPLLKSKIADLTNLPDHPGMITAGMFVGEFVEGKPWIHIDIAATSWADKKTVLEAEGATGVGVKMLYYLIKAI